MKIGIFTFSRACNYGAVLQAWALQEVLARLGHDVEIADYTPRRIRNAGRPVPPPPLSRHPRVMLKDFGNWIRQLPGQLRHFAVRSERERAIQDFRGRHFRFSRSIHGRTIGKRPWNAVVVGSDQVWNIGLTAGVDAFYWGVAFPDEVRRIAYAVSAGGSLDHVSSNESCLKAAGRFKAVGVRESELKERLSAALPPASVVVLDPVLLLSRWDWLAIAKKPEWAGEEEYLLLYRVADSTPAKRTAQEWASSLGTRVVEICIGENYPSGKNEKYGIHPQEFVWLFAHAKSVVAASFHGVAFSIMFGKPFLAFGTGASGDGRLKELLETTGLSDRFRIDSPGVEEKFPETTQVDLRRQRDLSLAFLKEALQE